MFKRVLIPYDDSPPSKLALKHAINLCKDQKASLRVVYYLDYVTLSAGVEGVDTKMLHDSFQKEAMKILKKALKSASLKNVKCETELIESFKPIAHRFDDEILKHAKRCRSDLLVIGTHGHRNVKRIFFGSQTDNIIRKTHIPVLVVRKTT